MYQSEVRYYCSRWGHAGCEAALASARLNNKTLLITGNIENIADMPCNPSIGGPAKGIIVREIDYIKIVNNISGKFCLNKQNNNK